MNVLSVGGGLPGAVAAAQTSDVSGSATPEDVIVALYRRFIRGLWSSIILGGLSVFLLLSAASTLTARPVPPIEAIGSQGRFAVAPLRNLAMSQRYIADWAARTITAAYAINPVDFETVLTRVRHRFTVAAWRSFAASYKSGGDVSDLHKLLSEQLTGFAQYAAPVIVHRTFGPRAEFTVAFPLIVSWQNANGVVSRRYDVRVVVRRAWVPTHPGGLAIEKFTAVSKGV